MIVKRALIIGATAVVSAGLGLAAGYKLAVHRLNATYNEQMEDELAKTRAYYERNTKPFADPTEAVKALKPEEVVEVKEEARQAAVEMPDEEIPLQTLERVLDGLKYNKITPRVSAPTTVQVKERVVTPTQHNVFERDVLAAEDDPEHESMMEDRASETIYLVSQEEHMENPHEFQVVTLTFYDGDQVLADEEDKVIEKLEKAIGAKENLQFGRWSGDGNVVYIRNETLDAEFEILRSTGKYAVEVLGLDPA